jgi:hypothetical protein
MRTGILFVLALAIAVAAYAQTGAITGRIVTVSGGNPVPEASVHVKNSATAASF